MLVHHGPRSSRRKTRLPGTIAAAVALAVLSLPSGASATTVTFDYTADAQGYSVPSQVTRAVVQAFGASGAGDPNVPGGLGGGAVSTLHFHNANERALAIYVGGAGGTADGSGDGTAPGGFNGGGDGGHRDGLDGGSAGGGGGASDVRRWVAGFLHERVIVAGGGGGATSFWYHQFDPFLGLGQFRLGCAGGAGGGTTGGSGYATAQPYQPGSVSATCTNPNTTGAGGGSEGSVADGGDGQPGSYPGGGGGGGWSGGGGGIAAGPSGGAPSALGGSGGGGSGYTWDGHGLTSGVHGGNGQVLITYSSIDSVAVNTPTATVGDDLHVTADLDGYNPTGRIKFGLYGPGDNDCSGDPVFDDVQTASKARFTSEDFTLTQAGTYRWVISYSGDDDNDAVSTPCAGDGNSVLVAPLPPTGLASSPGSPSNSNTPKITGTAAAGSSVSIYTSSDCSGTAAATGSATDFASPGLAVSVADNSTTTFYARAVNGGASLCSADSSTYVEDSVAPTADIDSQPPARSTSTTAAFTTSSDEAGSTFECKLDAADFVSCPSTGVTYSGLADGTHDFAVRATDVAGNTSEPERFTWAIDTVPPVVTFASKPAANSNSTSAVLTYSSSEGGSTFECGLDGQAFASCPAEGTSLSGLSVGTHHFAVRATDPAGNVSLVATWDWTIDTTPPQPTILSQPPSQSTSSVASFTYGASEPDSAFECRIDSQSFASCPTAGITYPDLADGPHTFNVQATDLAGNTGSAVTYSWSISTAAPPKNATESPGHPSPAARKKAKIAAVTVTGPAGARVGKRTTFKVKVTNNGTATATGVKLISTGKGIKLTKTPGRIAAGQTKTVIVKLKLKRTGRIRIAFKVTSTNAGSRTTTKVVTVRSKP